ncbi:MAG: transglycosylase SLT domain-containing protein [Bdellovibrionota bacterium]
MLTIKNYRQFTIATLAAAALLLLATENSAFAFGAKPITPPPATKPPVTTPPVTTPPVTGTPGLDVRARWETKNRDGATWSQYVYDQLPVLGASMLAKNPSDISNFCANYSNLNLSDKKNFWVYMLSAMSERESGQDPAQTYKESFNDAKGNSVISTGLLQISIESANSYGCGFTSQSQLTDPERNLACGLKILNRWIGQDGLVSGKSGTAWRGGARYWSTLRTGSSLTAIQGWTQALRICTK